MQRRKLSQAIKQESFDEDVSDASSETTTSHSSDPILPAIEREHLILDNQDAANRMSWRMLNAWRIRFPLDEVRSIAGAALCEAAWRFDPKRKVAFKTFLFYHLRGMLIKEVIRQLEAKNNHSFGADEGTSFDPELAHVQRMADESDHADDALEKKQMSELCWKACAQLDALEQEVIVRTFVYDQPLVEVAESLGYCRCHISRVKSSALRQLRQILKESSFSPLAIDGPQRIQADRRIRDRYLSERLSYTGGRGRRKESDISAPVLEKILRQIAA